MNSSASSPFYVFGRENRYYSSSVLDKTVHKGIKKLYDNRPFFFEYRDGELYVWNYLPEEIRALATNMFIAMVGAHGANSPRNRDCDLLGKFEWSEQQLLFLEGVLIKIDHQLP